MKIYFENKSKDLGAEITFNDNSVLNVPFGSSKEFEINENNITFSVKYVRDFTFGYQFAPKVDGKITDQITNKLTEKGIKWSKDLSVVASDKATFDSQEWDKTATSEDCFLLGGNNNYWIYARKIIRSNKSKNTN